jgi:hypothetical protein
LFDAVLAMSFYYRHNSGQDVTGAVFGEVIPGLVDFQVAVPRLSPAVR